MSVYVVNVTLRAELKSGECERCQHFAIKRLNFFHPPYLPSIHSLRPSSLLTVIPIPTSRGVLHRTCRVLPCPPHRLFCPTYRPFCTLQPPLARDIFISLMFRDSWLIISMIAAPPSLPRVRFPLFRSGVHMHKYLVLGRARLPSHRCQTGPQDHKSCYRNYTKFLFQSQFSLGRKAICIRMMTKLVRFNDARFHLRN